MPSPTKIGSLSSRGFGQFGSAKKLYPRIEFIESRSSSSNASSYTIPSLNIGSAAIDRVVIFAITTVTASASQLSATINGSTANRFVSYDTTWQNTFFTQLIQSGSSTSAVISANGIVINGISIGVYVAYGLDSFTASTGESATYTATERSATLSVPTASAGIAIGCGRASPAATNGSANISFTGITRDYVTFFPSGSFGASARGSGSKSGTIAGSLSITASSPVSGIIFFGAVSFR